MLLKVEQGEVMPLSARDVGKEDEGSIRDVEIGGFILGKFEWGIV